MRTYRGAGGPLRERPYFQVSEIEQICNEALETVGLLPTVPEPVRIDRFVEKRFELTIEYDDLGPGVLGVTRFGAKGVQAVTVSRSLDEEGTQVGERRVRSTIAHEAGHGLLHAHLFVLEGAAPLFGETAPTGPKVLCRDEPQTAGYRGHWWEWQANRAIGALLLPRRLALRAVETFTEPDGALGLQRLSAARHSAAVAHLVEVFDVNPVVARLRLDELFPREGKAQAAL